MTMLIVMEWLAHFKMSLASCWSYRHVADIFRAVVRDEVIYRTSSVMIRNNFFIGYFLQDLYFAHHIQFAKSHLLIWKIVHLLIKESLH